MGKSPIIIEPKTLIMKGSDTAMQVPRLLTVFVAARSVSKFIYRVNYQLAICMRMKKVFTGAELDGQPECRISFLAKILVQLDLIVTLNWLITRALLSLGQPTNGEIRSVVFWI